MPERRAGRSLLLVELASREHWVYNSRYFPFVKGAAEKLGIPSRWLCFGAAPSIEKKGRRQVRQYRVLTPQDQAWLCRQATELRPTHIITSHPLPPAVRESLRRRLGKAVSWLSLSDQPELAALAPRADWLLDWLGERGRTSPRRGQYLVGAFAPSYEAVMGNAAFRENKPHIVIMGGPSCDHDLKLRDNELYWELSPEDLAEASGCGFCTHDRRPTSDPRADPVAVAREQFLRVQATAGAEGRDCGIFDLWDIRLFDRLPRFFTMIQEVGLAPGTFCFEPRIDRFLRNADALERLIPSLARQGHKISLLRMGAESLVEAENEFYNKHISLAQIDAATRRLQDLSARFPETFSHDPTYGYISCSPWTTLEAFATGVQRAMERGFDPKGIWLYTPLLLYHNSPLERLARRQGGIIQKSAPDLSLLYEPAVNECPFTRFANWRFRDERLAAAFALIVRFCAAALRDKYPDSLFAGDSLYRSLLKHAADRAFYERPDFFAVEVPGLLQGARPPFDKAALLAAALERYGRRRANAPRLSGAQADAAGDAERGARQRVLLEAVLRRLPEHFAGVRVLNVRDSAAEASIFVEFGLDSGACRLVLTDRATTPRWMFQAGQLAATCDPKTPLSSPTDQKKLERLLRLFDFALSRHAPELRPGPKPGA